MASFPPDELRSARIVAGGMLAGAVFFLSLALAMRTLADLPRQMEIVTWLACGFALLSPVSGVFVGALVARNPSSAEVSRRRSAMLIQYGQMEAAVLFCGVALMVGPYIWPLLAALVPLGVMVAEFPRGAVPRTG